MHQMADGRFDGALCFSHAEFHELLGQLGGLLLVVETLGHDLGPVEGARGRCSAVPRYARPLAPGRHLRVTPVFTSSQQWRRHRATLRGVYPAWTVHSAHARQRRGPATRLLHSQTTWPRRRGVPTSML
ncbi:hypothetical protein D9M71_585910 [compost metagenome]